MEQLSINATGCDVCTDKSTDETGEAYCKDHNNKVISTKPLNSNQVHQQFAYGRLLYRENQSGVTKTCPKKSNAGAAFSRV
jgi:hypothetical protein